MKLVIAIIGLLLFALQLIDAYGESYNGIPSLQEREAINLVNLARMSPKSYVGQFFNNNQSLWDKNEEPILIGYEKVRPVYLDGFLSRLAMAMSVGKYDAFTGTSDAVVFINSLLCVPYTMSHYRNNQPKTICSNDFQNDFTRKIIMNSDWYSYGIGYYNPSSNSEYWSHTFKNNDTCSPPYNCNAKDIGKIYSGFHTTASTLMTMPDENGYFESSVFFANYYSIDNTPISGISMNLIVNENKTFYVGRAFGNSTFGIYMTSLPFNDEYKCAPYYFQATDIYGGSYRYPTTGYLQFTRNETECPSFVDEIKPTRRPTKRPTPTPKPTRSSIPTYTPYPTKTSIPTPTPTRTSTPNHSPTYTPYPTNTPPYPTNSTIPTNTPTQYNETDSFTLIDYIIVFVFCIFVVSTIISSMK